jgi:hypothetical protein
MDDLSFKKIFLILLLNHQNHNILRDINILKNFVKKILDGFS